jgi:hypothetical protein
MMTHRPACRGPGLAYRSHLTPLYFGTAGTLGHDVVSDTPSRRSTMIRNKKGQRSVLDGRDGRALSTALSQ